MAADITFRDYQLDAIRSIYRDCGLFPAGPSTDEIVACCGGDGTRQDSDYGRAGSELAGGSSDDDQSPF